MSDPTADDDALDYALLDALRGDDVDYDGPLDHPCPLCGPDRQSEYNQTRTVLRTWKPSSGFITYYCTRCEAKGYAHADAPQVLQPRPKMPPPVKPRATSGDDYYVRRLWEERGRSRLTDDRDDAVNQLRRMQEIADRIGIDARDATLGIKLARTGRMDLISAVASGRMSIRSALARAQTQPVTATPETCR